MNSDHDFVWLAERHPELASPSPAQTDRVRASLLARGRAERRRRRGRQGMAVASVLGAAAVAIAIPHGSGDRPMTAQRAPTLTTAPGAAATTPRAAVTRTTPLVKLAADVRLLPSLPQPGDATLVVRHTVLSGTNGSDGAVFGGYDLYTDSGQYFYAPDSLAELQQEVGSDKPVIGSGNEAQALDTIAAAAAGTPAQARHAVLSTFPHGLDPMPTPAQVRADERHLAQAGKRLPYIAMTPQRWRLHQDSELWIAATQALAVGAGRSDVRAGAMKALSTLGRVTQTPTHVNGTSALKVAFPDGGAPEIIWLNANTGVPIQEQDGSDSATTYEVQRVTAAQLPAQIAPGARLR